MDPIALTSEQEMLQKAVRNFAAKECPSSILRELEKSDLGYSPDHWKKMAELGWLGLIFPEEYGGIGGNFIDLAILYEELGRTLVPSPHFASSVLGGLTLLEAGSEEQKKSILTKVADGEINLTLAVLDEIAEYNPEAITTKAVHQGNGYVINGKKFFVPYAHVANYILCVARTSAAKGAEEGISIFLVNPKISGLTITPLNVIGGEKLFELNFNDVCVMDKDLVGKEGKGWSVISNVIDKAKVALCARMVGGALATLDETVEYAKVRVAFGRPIGSFQANSFKLAERATEIDGAKLLAYRAAWLISEGLAFRKEAAMAKAYLSDVYRRSTIDFVQVHGGYGFMEEYDPQLYYRRAKAEEVLLGDTERNREIIGEFFDKHEEFPKQYLK
ncbi:MAG: acyl-CoA/acyl-ACP dehydrogenase [Candidatus Tectomicrobia bacterium]|uniref:Acyl-CoA/acyl-ACP dehydrogenase n=1 Tax=Tectimicrobiota bacterium TaxID=2528274 RepID=A0A933GMI1_UNCTE|nr:acyl-CoA/acyl-ACP dehydrogenase [Candidatus Tectomicrobia bacterium]